MCVIIWNRKGREREREEEEKGKVRDQVWRWVRSWVCVVESSPSVDLTGISSQDLSG